MISGLAFFVILLLFIGILQHFQLRGKRHVLIKKLRDREGDIGLPEAVKEAPPHSKSGILKPVVSLLNILGKRFAPGKSTDSYSSSKIMFMRAGHGQRSEHALASFWGAKILLAISLPLLFILLRLLFFNKVVNPLVSLYVCLFIAFMGFYLPNILLHNKIAKRKDIIFKSLPDAIDLLVICVEAGIGLDAAINQVAKELKFSNPVLSEEFNLFTLEMRTGKARKSALRSLALRTGLEEIDSLVTLLIQTEKFGTSVSRSLRVFSDSFRTKRFQKAEEIAARLPVKLVFPCILFIFPSLFAVLAGPAAIRIYEILINR